MKFTQGDFQVSYIMLHNMTNGLSTLLNVWESNAQYVLSVNIAHGERMCVAIITYTQVSLYKS